MGFLARSNQRCESEDIVPKVESAANLHDYEPLIESSILAPTFVRAVFSGKQLGQVAPWMKVIVRQVQIKEERRIQFVYFDQQKSITKNYQGNEALVELQKVMAAGFKNLHILTTTEAIQINLSKRGKVTITRTKTANSAEIDLSHDRKKQLYLPEGKPDDFLQAVGIMSADGKVKAGMWNKYRQINEFLKIVDHTIRGHSFPASPIRMIDFGCGNAYLTFAAYHYLHHILGLPASLIGVDVKSDLVQRNRDLARDLGWNHITFEMGRIMDFRAEAEFDIVIALHACDTATDEALAQAIRMQSELIFCAPCCHHHLQEQLARQSSPKPFHPVLQHGILKERLGDVLTDAFRAVILRILGYNADVIQFVSSEHTAKNLMIRATKSVKPGELRYIQEYEALKEYWHVTPYLEQIVDPHALNILKAAWHEGAVDSFVNTAEETR
jgi:SAM-dependent methyltransferase